MARRLLWITPKFPIPADDGARIATANLLSGLVSLGEDIHLIALAGTDENCDIELAKKVLGVAAITVIRRASTPSNKIILAFQLVRAMLLNPWLPLTMRHYGEARVVSELEKILQEEPDQSCIVYDGLHCAAHRSQFGRYIKNRPMKVVYRAHNRESSIWERSISQARSPKRWLLKFQARRVQVFERSVLEASDGVATVSHEDLEGLTKDCGNFNGKIVPIGYDFTAPLPSPQASQLNIMFLGKLNWPPNRDGLAWFLEKVWPLVTAKRPELGLIVAGSGATDMASWISAMPGVTFKGRVEQTQPLYLESILSIIPVFYGSGTRVKAIEACRFGRACLSTAIGVEGIGLRPDIDYYCGETAQEWVEILIQLSADKALKMGVNAFENAKQRFERKTTALAFQQLLTEIC